MLLSPCVTRLTSSISSSIQVLNHLGCESLHVDVCDGPLLFQGFIDLDTVDPDWFRWCRARITFHFFLASIPQNLRLDFVRVTDLAILHVFPSTHDTGIKGFVDAVHSIGSRVGVAVDVDVEPERIKPFIPYLDTVFLMGIPAGTHSQPLHPKTTQRLITLRNLLESCDSKCRLGIDGGVNENTFRLLAKEVDELVVGGLLFNADDMRTQWKLLNSF